MLEDSFSSGGSVHGLTWSTVRTIAVLLLLGAFLPTTLAQVDGTLNVTLDTPSQPVNVLQNTTFTVNATVECAGTLGTEECGEVNGTVRYNASSTAPDTPISTTDGDTPFHTTGNGNPIRCPNSPLFQGDACQLDWSINATGTPGTTKRIDVNFASNRSGVAANDTRNEEISIVSTLISFTMDFGPLGFGTHFPGTTGNEATGNSNSAYTLALDADSSEQADIWINMTDLTAGRYTLGATNITWNDTESTYDGSTRMANSPTRVRQGVSPGTSFDMFFWIDIPFGIAADLYEGTIEVKANATA